MPAYSSNPTSRQKKVLVAGALAATALVSGAGAAAAAHVPGFHDKPGHSQPDPHRNMNKQQFKDCTPVAGFIPSC